MMVCIISRFIETHPNRRVDFIVITTGLPAFIFFIVNNLTVQIKKQIKSFLYKNSCMIHIILTLQEQLKEGEKKISILMRKLSKFSDKFNLVWIFDLPKFSDLKGHIKLEN